MGSSIYFPLSAIPFSLLLIFLIYFRKTINSEETRIYKRLVMVNMIGLNLELLCSYASIISNSNPVLSDIILKSYLVYNVVWTYILTLYVYNISRPYDNKNKTKKIKLISMILLLISIIVIYATKCILYVSPDFSVRYTEGPSVSFTYTLCGILIALMVILIISAHNMKNKKYIPIYSFLVTIVLGIIIQINIPGLLIMTFIETLTLNIMYFTIENPDIKLVEEMARNRELIEKGIEAKSNLLFEISQDVRNPIDKIKKLSSDILNEKKFDTAKIYANEINIESKELSLIVNNVLDVSGMDMKNIQIYSNNYNPSSVFKTVQMQLNDKLDEGVKLNFSISDSIPKELYGDSVKLKQILVSVLSNSIKYTKKGIIDLKVNCIEKYDICRMIINIEDTGIGMDIGQVNSILTSENNLNDNDIKELNKLDINLKLVNKIIKELGGYFMVKSQLGKGTKTTIILDQKIKIYENDTNVLESMAKEYMTGKKLIIVDNNTNVLKKLSELIKNYDVTTTMYGKDIIKKIENGEKFDLIVLGDEMNPDSGLDTFNELKKIKDFKIPTMIMLNKNKESIKEHYLKEGFTDYILLEKLDTEISKINNYI